MTIARAANGAIELVGECTVDDAEPLLQHLLAAPNASIVWHDCTWIHTAVVQVLLAAKRAPIGSPRSDFLRERIVPLLGGTS